MLARGRIGQKWPECCRQGEFISARGQTGQRSHRPEVQVNRGHIGQRLNWPGAACHGDIRALKNESEERNHW